MPVTCTDTPKVLRVTYTAFEDDFTRREVVCFLQPNPRGQINILYSHHMDSTRGSDSGPWDGKHQFKLPLSKSTMSEISSHVMHEFWDAFGFNVKDLARDSKLFVPIAEVQMEGGIKFV